RIIKKGSGIIHPGPVRIIISPPIDPRTYFSEEEGSILTNIRDIIVKNLEEHRLVDGKI
ncbi:MAG: hypothetical protein IIA62_07715, partial [Nitrospinae bacterium]|nr:hypothetical protein [Nitrospinota bacterium]